jgi:glycosyltransferase involved in cell wall biosynthesis
MGNLPKVSVCIITYNHEKYIEAALEGVLNQQTDFSYEVVIGEDFSTDNTRAILKTYLEKYPDKIRLLLPDKNIGMMSNFIATLQACRGEFIAICEGDDYWTDPTKLQKQADFLDANPDFVICFHDVEVVYENPTRNYLFSKYFTFDKKDVFTIADTIKGWFMPTCSIMYRKVLTEFPDWFYKVKSGDIALSVLLAQYGKIKYLPFVMGAYRKHEGGISVGHHGLTLVKNNLGLFADFERYFKNRYKKEISSARLGLFKEFFDKFEAISQDLNMGLDLLKTVSPWRAFILTKVVSLNFKAFKILSWRIL